MKVFVTGGTGFIGRHVVDQLLTLGHQVIALRLPGETPKTPQQEQLVWVEGTLADDWRHALKNADALIHLAAVGVSPQKASWEKLFAVNVQQSLHLWLQAAEAGVARFILSGSCVEYGRSAERYTDCIPADAPLEPTGAYAASKAAASVAAMAFAMEKNVELLILRLFHVFGEGQHGSNFWPSLKAAALSGEDFPMTLGEQVRDFTPVEKAAAFFAQAVGRQDLVSGKPLVENVGTGTPQTLRAFAEHWWHHWQAKGQLQLGSLPYRENEVMRYVPRLPLGAENHHPV